jgi:hypothetical protein
MIPKLTNGKTNAATCVTFEIRNLPSLATKISKVSAYADSDHFQAGIELSELEFNDMRTTEGTLWQYRWLDDKSHMLTKSGAVITGYKLNYSDIDGSLKQIKTCVFDIVNQQCVKESTLEGVPTNNVPEITILDITGQYKQGGGISPLSRTSYAYTQPAADFTYRWNVAGVMLSDNEKTAAELILKDASYFGKDITVCMQRAYKNFTGTDTTSTVEVCKTKQFSESDVQVTASYDYGYNLLLQTAPLVFSGKFNGIDSIDYSTFKLKYQGKLLNQGTDYTLTTTFGHNDFTFIIHSQQLKPTTEYGEIFSLQCEFTYNSKLYSCIGGSNAADTASTYATGGLATLRSTVIGTVAEKNRIAFQRCRGGDKLTWWLKDKDADSYRQVSNEEVIREGDICYGNNPDGSFYLDQGLAGKKLKLIVKRVRNGLDDARIQVLNIDLGEISE